MRRLAHPVEDRVFRVGAGTIGGVLLASAGLAADLARDHMALLGAVCGANAVPHCGWCYGTAGLVLSAFAAFAVALAPPRAVAVSRAA